jgi:hypothetical protein
VCFFPVRRLLIRYPLEIEVRVWRGEVEGGLFSADISHRASKRWFGVVENMDRVSKVISNALAIDFPVYLHKISIFVIVNL